MPSLEFKGKYHVYAHHLTVPHRPLVPDTERSENGAGVDDSLIIHGDNLHALKALLPRYAGRVKCIYIDPPYNTGNEGWVYNDRVNSPLMKEWLKANSPVDGEDLERHDKWLCMMWPRMQLLKELLCEDGVIFVSIDDNEQHHLRMLMDDVFGEDNYRNSIVIRRGVKSVQAQFESVDSLNSGSEYMLFYSKSAEQKLPHLTTETATARAGGWNNHWRGTDRPTMRYELLGETPASGQWRWSEERSRTAIRNYERLLEECGDNPSQMQIDEWWFAQSPEKPDLLRLSSTDRPEHYVPPSSRQILSSLWTDVTVNESASLMQQLGVKFDNPKRISLIQRVIGYATASQEDSIVLDSFAGSGTTAHAVLALNKEDGGNRKFILVECEDYADSVTAERVRRVINGVPGARDKSLQEGLGGSFTYCTLGDPIGIEGMLTGESLPEYSQLASYLLHTASVRLDAGELHSLNEDGLFFSTEDCDYYLLYQPDLKWLRSRESFLTEDHAKRIQAIGKRATVFAVDKYMGQRYLNDMRITFCQIPYQIHTMG